METKSPEKGFKSLIVKSWNKSTFSRVMCIVMAIVVLTVLVVAVVFVAKLFEKGENVIIGSWHYDARINNAGDLDCDMNFAENGDLFIISTLASNSGTYALVKGGDKGAFVTYVSGEEIMYDYVYDAQSRTMTITNQDGYSMLLTRMN